MAQPNRLWRELLAELAAFCCLIASVVLMWRNNRLLFAVMVVESVAALGLWHQRFDLCLFLIIGVLGSLAELVFTRLGVWHYANPTWLGIPAWFPLAFGTTGLIGGRLARTLTAMWDEARPRRDSEG